jgi:hypothetical protein
MSMNSTKGRLGGLSGKSVPWVTVLGLAAVMAYADGFWLTSLQGAVGAIERSQDPFNQWLRGSTLMLPVFAVAVLWALSRAHRKYGPALRRPRAIAAAALLVAAAGSVVGVGQLVASSAYDYHLQSNLINSTAYLHNHVAPTATPAQAATESHSHGSGDCTGTCEARRATLAAHLTGVAYAAVPIMGSNLLLVGWVVALRGGRLEPRRQRRSDGEPLPEALPARA